jgi:hypothetical protein
VTPPQRCCGARELQAKSRKPEHRLPVRWLQRQPSMTYLVRLSLLLVLVAGCEDSAEGVRRGYLDRHQSSFVYEGTTRDWVMKSVRTVITDKGFILRDAPEADGTYRTERTSRGKKLTGEFIVRFIDLRWRQGFMVHVMYVIYDDNEVAVSSVRDDGVEWEIIQRADPDRAVQMMTKANDRADKVPPRTYPRKTNE